jgi:putative 4-mercaptohistidine N1-methyltranferase
MNIYETQRLVDEYLLFHYGTDAEVLPWTFGPSQALRFAVRTVNELLDRDGLSSSHASRALDLGCAVGRSCYELADVSTEVIGVDFSQAFIAAAEALRAQGSLPYSRLDEGAARTALTARRPSGAQAARILFEQGDAMHLRGDLRSFEVVHAANLLCRLSDPQRLLDRLPSLVKPGGQLLLTTPCTWLEEFTPPQNWPLGSTFDWLSRQLTPHFELALRKDMPFLIREHARKYQWSVALGMRWLRKAD